MHRTFFSGIDIGSNKKNYFPLLPMETFENDESFWKEKESIITCILKKIYILYKINHHKSNMTICMTGHTFTSRCQLQIWYFSRAGHPCHRRRECVFFASRQGGSDAKNVFLIFGRLTDSRHYQSIEPLNRNS